jgi:hypothetical protein
VRKPSSIFFGISILLLALFSAGCGSSSPNVTVSLTPSETQTIDQGQAVSIKASLTNDTSGKGVTWSLTGSGSLSNKTSTSVTYDAPASVSTGKSATVTATSAADTTATASVAIAVNPPPSITTTSLPSGIAGTSYNQSLTETGGTSPFTWGVVNGQIPPGLTLNSGGGGITGTPTQSGTFNFSVKLSDSAGLSATKSLSITIAPAPALSVTTTTLANGALNMTYSSVLSATGGAAPYSWSLAGGNLPAGMGLSASGVISGTPTATGTSTITVEVTDSQTPSPATATATLTLIINPMPYSISTTSLPQGTIGIAYSTTLQASGGVAPNNWTIDSGSLPGWATLDASTGVISGTPNATGTTSFTVRATDSESPAAMATQSLSITVTGTQNGLLSGQYAFSLGGYRGGLAGSFTADGNGNITGGTEDLVNATNAMSAKDVAISSGTYAVGTDYRGTLSYTDANNNTFTFDFSLKPVSSAIVTSGAMIETDATGNDFTGYMALQDPNAFSTSKMSGSYVFGLTGWDASGNSNVIVGSATVTTGSVNGGALDQNDGGTVTSNKSFTGTLAVSSSGRGTLTSSVASANFTFYVVSSSQWMAIASNPSTGAVATGIVREQSPEPYAASYVTGNLVYETESATSTPAPQATLGLLTSPGDGTASFTFDVDAGGAVSTDTGKGTLDFSSSSNGRFTLTLQTLQGTSDLVGYMISTNQAFVLGTDSTPSFGTFQPQENVSFTNSSLNGAFFFGSQPLVAAPSSKQAPVIASGVLSFDGNGTLSGTTDSKQAGTVTTSQLSGTYTVGSNGRVTILPGGSVILYIVSPNKAMALYVGQAGYPNPFIQKLEH